MFDAACVLFAERQGPQCFGEQREPLDTHRDLAAASLEQLAFGPDVVAQIQQFDQLVRLGAEHVDFEVELDLAGRVLEMGEGRLAVGPQRDQTPGQAI